MEAILKTVCVHCRGSGWLCDVHPDQPWDHDEFCDGAGVVCSCNAPALAPHDEVFVEFDVMDEGTR
jgi:hypothetical protein